jgi:hypothetical protein
MRAGSINYQVDWQLSWFAECFPQTRADHRRDSLDEYDEYIAMDGGVHAIEPEIMALLTSHFRFGPFTMWDQPLPS